MSYNRLIHDYLDGALDQTSEEALFAHLSGDSGLRSEFNLQMKLNKLVTADLGRVTVPSELTGAVFARVGFATAANVPMAYQDKSPNDFAKRYSGFVLLLLLLFTGISSIYLLNQNNALKDIVSNKDGAKSVPVTESYSSNESNYEANSQLIASENSQMNSEINSNSAKFGDKQSDLRNSGSNLYGSNKRGRNSELQVTQTNNKLMANSSDFSNEFSSNANGYITSTDRIAVTNSEINMHHPLSIFSEGLKSNYGQINDYNPIANQYTSNSMFQDLILRKWSFQLRHISNQGNYPAVSVGSDNNFLADNSIGFWYNYSPSLSFGIESGVEKFTQEFVYENLNYSQAPMISWVGLSVKYNEEIIPFVFNPYISQSIAYTTVGMLSRTQGGLVFNVSSPLSLFVGAEWGVLLYNVSGNLYDSHKFGLTCGINFNIR